MAGKFSPNDQACREGMTDWQPLAVVISATGTPPVGAAQALGCIGEVRAVDPLVNKLREQSAREWRSRRDSAKALGLLGDKRAVETLIWVLRYDGNDQVRAEAAIALGLLGDDAAVAPLAELSSHKNKRGTENN